MKRGFVFLLLCMCGAFGASASIAAETIDVISFPKSGDLERCDVYVSHVVSRPRAILVLCPGQNGNSRGRLDQEEWKRFARENNLDLAAISFVSPDTALHAGGGYFDARKGAGDHLLEAIRRSLGGDAPLLFYGFSGGAHFVNSFVNWKPESVLAFCAYSAAWWEKPVADGAVQPGIVACGADDPERCSASQTFFSQGRADGKSWTWLNLAGIGHQESKALDNFVRLYFSAILENKTGDSNGEWYDVDTKRLLTAGEAKEQPTLACWLPNSTVAEIWLKLHQP